MTSYKDRKGKEMRVGDVVMFGDKKTKGIFLGIDEKGKFLVLEEGKHIDGSKMCWTWELLNGHIELVEKDKMEDIKWEGTKTTSLAT